MSKIELIIYNLCLLVINIIWLIMNYCVGNFKVSIFNGIIIGFILFNIFYISSEIEK